MYQLVYVSSASQLLDKEELISILKKSRKNNALRGITGLLLYREGNILQVLEGEKAVVDQVFAKVSKDDRHHGVITLIRDEIAEREFPDWSMGFRDLTSAEIRNTPGFSEFLNTPLNADEFRDSGRTAKLLRIFRQ